jgi:hypothetical protein
MILIDFPPAAWGKSFLQFWENTEPPKSFTLPPKKPPTPEINNGYL